MTASWNNFGGNAQHTDVSQVAAQPLNHLLWSTPLDLAPWGAVHYGDPVFTPGNTVVVPIKVTWSAQDQNQQNFYLAGLNDVTGQVLWTSAVTGSITAASNASPIVITTGSTSGLATGESVTIGGVNGNTAANSSFTITVLNSTQFQLNGSTGNGAYTSGGTWAYNPNGASYIAPTYNWLAPLQPVYDPVTDRVYFAGPGGTIDYINHPDSPGSSTPTVFQEAFYGLSNYTANEAAYNSSIYINTGLTVDSSGNVYFGFTETGTNPSGINDGGFARITPTGAATSTLAYAAVSPTTTNDGNWNPALGQSPALSNDGSTIYFGVTDSGYALNRSGESSSYLVGLNSTTLAPQYSAHLLDPSTGNGARLIDESTASPMVAPDNTIYMGVFSSVYNGSRGFLLHYTGNLGTEYTPGAFGWDDTPSIVPTSMVPSYTGSSPYLILSKYNNYANTEVGQPYGGNGVNQIAILDPYASQLDPNYDANPNLQVMKQVMAMTSISPDIPNATAGDPNAVREWCTNGSVVDPGTDSVYVNNEDGYTYQWNLGTGLVTNAVQITSGVGVPYTPTAIAPNGEIYSDNGGTLFALGGYSNYTMSTVSSANPAVVGTTVTLTTTLASTNNGATPTGTVTYSYFQGANNPLNYNTTPVTIGTAPVVNGVASIQVSGLAAAHYHIYASYSGDSNYSSGQTILVQPVLETATTTITSSSPNPANAGASVTFTVTVAPNGTTFVPIGTVTFMDGSTVLGTASLNNLENETNPPSTNTATFTTSSLPGGTDTITAVYNGDQNFAAGTSAGFNESIPAVTNPGTQNSAVGDSVSLQVQASGLPSGDSWTFSATGLPSGLSINTSTGAITGTITGSANAYSASVTAADGTKASATQSFTWNVSALSVTNPGTQNSALGASALLQIHASGLPSGDTWTYSATGLPSGLSVNPSSGLITGTITGTPNSYAASVSASDGQGGSASQSFTWNVGATTTSVTSGVNPSVYGQRVTFTAKVAPVVTGSAKPTGTVTFMDGTTVLSTVTLNTFDKANFTTSAFALAVGGNSITAVYSGDSTFETSTSSILSQTVNKDGTTATVTSSAPTAVVGQRVVLTAAVTANSPGSGKPTGTVTFYQGTTFLGQGTLNTSGNASLAISSLPLGSDSITATYAGDGHYLGTTSAPFTETINQAATKTVVATSNGHTVFGQSVTFTATVKVASPGTGTPTGTVTFMDGAAVLGTGTLNSAGQATYTTSSLAVGSHSITAVYGSDTNFTTSTSLAITQKVTKSLTTATVTSPQSSVPAGTPVTFTATVVPTAPGTGVPTGTVTFYDGTTVLGTVALNSSGQATLTMTWTTAGTHNIKVKYNGDADFDTITSAILTETVT